MEAFAVAPAGFLLAVLWFDLMFDVQVRSGNEPTAALESISAYYRRVTTDARPMNTLVSLAMLATLTAIVVEVISVNPIWLGWASLPFALGPMAFAISRTVPTAVRLGANQDPADVQLRLARSVLRDHIVCFASIATLIALQLIAAAR